GFVAVSDDRARTGTLGAPVPRPASPIGSGPGLPRGPGSRSRLGLRAAGIGLGAMLGTGLAFRLSPRPSVALLRRVGERVDEERIARLRGNAALEPDDAVTVELDAPYGPAPSNLLDVFGPENRTARPTV